MSGGRNVCSEKKRVRVSEMVRGCMIGQFPDPAVRAGIVTNPANCHVSADLVLGANWASFWAASSTQNADLQRKMLCNPIERNSDGGPRSWSASRPRRALCTPT